MRFSCVTLRRRELADVRGRDRRAEKCAFDSCDASAAIASAVRRPDAAQAASRKLVTRGRDFRRAVRRKQSCSSPDLLAAPVITSAAMPRSPLESADARKPGTNSEYSRRAAGMTVAISMVTHWRPLPGIRGDRALHSVLCDGDRRILRETAEYEIEICNANQTEPPSVGRSPRWCSAACWSRSQRWTRASATRSADVLSGADGLTPFGDRITDVGSVDRDRDPASEHRERAADDLRGGRRGAVPVHGEDVDKSQAPSSKSQPLPTAKSQIGPNGKSQRDDRRTQVGIRGVGSWRFGSSSWKLGFGSGWSLGFGSWDLTYGTRYSQSNQTSGKPTSSGTSSASW